MSVKQLENGKWQVEIDRKGIPRVRKSFHVKEDAERFEREYLSKFDTKIRIITDRRTLLELVDIWYRYHGVNLADGDRRRKNVERMAVGMGNPMASELTQEMFLSYRYRRTQTDTDRVTSKTFNNQHGYLNAVYRKLFKMKVIDYDCPIAEVDFIKLQEGQTGYLSYGEIDILFDLLKNHPRNESVWWIAQLCIRTGARWSEAEKLTRKQLHNGRVTYVFTKSKKTRTIQLDVDFYNELITWAKYTRPNDRLFKNSINVFNVVVRQSDLRFPRGQMTHILRHSFASYFIMNGGSILSLQEILGHSDIKMTMRYAHLAPDHSIDAVRFNPLATGGKNGGRTANSHQ
ncbi:MAG: phage integrase [Methylobacter sp.]